MTAPKVQLFPKKVDDNVDDEGVDSTNTLIVPPFTLLLMDNKMQTQLIRN